MVEPAQTRVIPPPLICPRCLSTMRFASHGVTFELGVDVNFRKWACDCGQTCEQRWLVTE